MDLIVFSMFLKLCPFWGLFKSYRKEYFIFFNTMSLYLNLKTEIHNFN